MKAKDIKSVDDVSNYIEGCLNDFDEGISTKIETNKYLHELVVRVVEIAQANKPGCKHEFVEANNIEFTDGNKIEKGMVCVKCQAVKQPKRPTFTPELTPNP